MVKRVNALNIPRISFDKLLSLVVLSVLYAVLWKASLLRVNAFGCFDDCFNFVAGYFIAQGKTLYSQIFFNHQPLPAFISYVIQTLFDPVNIYELVLRHRQMVLVYSFIAQAILLLRFGKRILLSAVVYEISKFYVFGDRFLGEALVVYPLMYLAGLLMEKSKRLSWLDAIFSVIAAWFVIFTREPYALAAVVLYGGVLVRRRDYRPVITGSVVLGLLLTAGLLANLPLSDYWFNVVTVNKETIVALELQVNPLPLLILKGFLYPVWVLISTPDNVFHQLLYALSVLFCALSVFAVYRGKGKTVVMSWLILLLVNTRPTEPGDIFYAAFHMAVWFGMFCFLFSTLITEITEHNKRAGFVVAAGILMLLRVTTASSQAYLFERIDPQEEFSSNFGSMLQIGEGIRKLTNSSDTIFLDGFDDILYWQSKRLSPYPYSWYTSMMSTYPLYKNAREEMFLKNPPSLYYGSCPPELYEEGSPLPNMLPDAVKNSYVRLSVYGKPSCVFIRSDILPTIKQSNWEQAGEFGFSKPS